MRQTVCRPATTARVLVFLTALAAPAAAQETAAGGDSLPFRAAQRGMQFTIQDDGGSTGFLRFSSPRTAWTFDVSAFVSRSESESTSPFGGP